MRRTPLAAALALALTASGCALGAGVSPRANVAAPPTTIAVDADTPRTTTTTTPAAVTTTTPPTTTTTIAIDEAALRAVGANEAGRIMVLEYHLIEEPEGRWARTPANLRRDVQRLVEGGYYPITASDLARGRIDVPAGKTPVVLTFDDSSSGQCRYLADGRVDGDSACGILLQAAQDHPDDWSPAASFYVLLDVDVPDRVKFGQPEIAEQKMRDMVSWGMELGSHSISHFRLDQGDPESIQWQLAVPETYFESLVPGYELDTIALPLGMYPEDESLLASGSWEGQEYDHVGALEVSGGPAPSPHSAEFQPLRIPRIQVVQADFDYWMNHFAANPGDRYVSDGDPATVAVPASVEFTPRGDLGGLRVVRYED
ncbi:MAG: xylanase [Acidimicrobiia bacterium]|nr:xylanase [Acidimicrobiia bacterium]